MQKQCGSAAPRNSRYTKAELLAIAQARGIPTKSRDTLDELCAKLGMGQVVARPLSPVLPRPASPRPVIPLAPLPIVGRAASPRPILPTVAVPIVTVGPVPPVAAAAIAAVTTNEILPAPANTPQGQNLFARLMQAQAQGKVLDVTFVTETLTGSKIIAMPKTAASQKVRVPGLPMVSIPHSRGLWVVLQALGPNYAHYWEAFQRAAGITPGVRPISPAVVAAAAAPAVVPVPLAPLPVVRPVVPLPGMGRVTSPRPILPPPMLVGLPQVPLPSAPLPGPLRVPSPVAPVPLDTRGYPMPADTPIARELFARMLEAQAKRKILNITHLTQSYAGSRIVLRPQTTRSELYQIPGLPVYSMAESQGPALFLQALGPNYAAYLPAWERYIREHPHRAALSPPRLPAPILPPQRLGEMETDTFIMNALPTGPVPMPTLYRPTSPGVRLPSPRLPSPVVTTIRSPVIPAVPLPGSPRVTTIPVLTTPPQRARSPVMPATPRKRTQSRSPGSPHY